MKYPLISEYKEAILSAEDNFNELSSLRPILDSHGNPVISSGNFAVVFKMKDVNDGKLYAIKCFLKDQEGRDESYIKIANELETVSSSYILPIRYMEKEVSVNSTQSDSKKFPVVVMEWVEGETLGTFLNRNINDKHELEMLSFRFNHMAAWLLTQPFSHGDLKPDNILVRNDGSLVLVDYDGMFVPSMKGQKAREVGSPDYRHPSRTDADFDEHVDDFSIAVIALSMKALSLNPNLRSIVYSPDSLLLSEKDYLNPSSSTVLREIFHLMNYPEFALLFGIFSIALEKNNLDLVSFRLFMTRKPIKSETSSNTQLENLSTEISEKDIEEGIKDEHGVIYSRDGRRLIHGGASTIGLQSMSSYNVKDGTQVICDNAFWGSHHSLLEISLPVSLKSIGKQAFWGCSKLQSINIPNSVTFIGSSAFYGCDKLQTINIPDLISNINDMVFSGCYSLESIKIPKSVTSIGKSAFHGCSRLQIINIPKSVTKIGDYAFSSCHNLHTIIFPENIISIGRNPFRTCWNKYPIKATSQLSIHLNSNMKFKILENLLISETGVLIACFNRVESVIIPKMVKHIGDYAFYYCDTLRNLSIPDSVTSIGNSAFEGCDALQSVDIPDSITIIGDSAFRACEALSRLHIPPSVTSIGKNAFLWCTQLKSICIPKSKDIEYMGLSHCPHLVDIKWT